MNSSILYKNEENFVSFDMDTVVADLHIDKIIDKILDVRKEYAVRDYFFQKPVAHGDVLFRLSVIKELENSNVYGAVQCFLSRYNLFKLYLGYAHELPQIRTKQKWLLDALHLYHSCIRELHDSLSAASLQSEGMRRLADCLSEYRNTPEFKSVSEDAKTCHDELESIRYRIDMNLKDYTVVISKEQGEQDYFEELAHIFRVFDCQALDRQIIAMPGIHMGPLELMILDSLTSLYPGAFHMLESFYKDHALINHDMMDQFALEAQFYLSYIDYMRDMKEKGYAFSYPEFTQTRQIEIRSGYDVSLIDVLRGNEDVSANDFIPDGDKRCFVVTGPSRSGKTTYARMIGQILYFSLLGLPAPCSHVRTGSIQNIYTHFARQEDIGANFGRLKEELVRMKKIFDRDAGDSLLIFNEVLGSTTSYDAYQIGKKLFDKLFECGSICVFATHIYELADADERVAGIAMAVDDSGGRRVYKICDEKTTAAAASSNQLLHQYRLNYSDIKERVQ